MPCDVLNLEWSSAGRDREVASLICGTLRRHGFTVAEESVFDYRAALARHRPRLLYLADPRGAAANHAAALFAKQHGYPIVTFMAEGDVRPELLSEMFWGHVGGRELIEDLSLVWSARARELVLGLQPDAADRIKVAGAVGFDRYVIGEFPQRDEWLRERGYGSRRVVGYAGWTFDRLFPGVAGGEVFREALGDELVERFRADRGRVRAALEHAIDTDTDTLFLLKEHPGVTRREETELAGLEERPNVLLIRNEEPVGDCIAVSDVWTAFESTTCIEAWLLDTPTLLINPSGVDFPRTESHTGSPVVADGEELSKALNAGEPPGFAALQPARDSVIERTLGWSDGRNHLRAAHLIEELLARAPAEGPPLPTAERLRGAVSHALLATQAKARRRFSRAQLDEATARTAAALERFDPGHELEPQDIEELERINSATLTG